MSTPAADRAAAAGDTAGGAAKKTKVSIVAPVYNEAGVLNEFMNRLVKAVAPLESRYDFEFIFVDDGSRDGSLKLAKELVRTHERLKTIELRRNYGQTAALQAGIDEAEGAVIITMDADLQHFPEDIPLFLERIENGCDVVCGWRHKRREGIIRRWPSKVANMLIRKASGLEIHDIGTTFRAYRREILEDIRLLGENHRFVPVFAKSAGANIEEVKIENVERPSGKSNYGLSRTLNVFLDLFFIYFYSNYFDRPIRVFGKIALLFFAIGGTIVSVLLGMTIRSGTPVVYQRTGWIYLAALLVLTATQLLLTGILAEVIARIYFASSPRHTSYKVRRRWTPTDV
jgi:glycosyltransferase involved in cell wall biosynthesis